MDISHTGIPPKLQVPSQVYITFSGEVTISVLFPGQVNVSRENLMNSRPSRYSLYFLPSQSFKIRPGHYSKLSAKS